MYGVYVLNMSPLYFFRVIYKNRRTSYSYVGRMDARGEKKSTSYELLADFNWKCNCGFVFLIILLD